MAVLLPVVKRCFVGPTMNLVMVLLDKRPEASLQLLHGQHCFHMGVSLDNIGPDISRLGGPETCVQCAEKALDQSFLLWTMAMTFVKLDLEFLCKLFYMMG